MDPILAAGTELMLIGMGTVFIFLSVLVVATKAMSAVVQRFVPVRQVVNPQMVTDSTLPTAEEVAAVSAAIHQHRAKRNS